MHNYDDNGFGGSQHTSNAYEAAKRDENDSYKALPHENMLSDGEIALRIMQGKTPEDQACFMVNWLRGTIVIPEEVKLRIWLMENERRGLNPTLEG